MLEHALVALDALFDRVRFAALFAGMLVGMIVWMLPGLGGVAAVAGRRERKGRATRTRRRPT
jgi:putative tricarboxylic transport membrane protein